MFPFYSYLFFFITGKNPLKASKLQQNVVPQLILKYSSAVCPGSIFKTNKAPSQIPLTPQFFTPRKNSKGVSLKLQHWMDGFYTPKCGVCNQMECLDWIRERFFQIDYLPQNACNKSELQIWEGWKSKTRGATHNKYCLSLFIVALSFDALTLLQK